MAESGSAQTIKINELTIDDDIKNDTDRKSDSDFEDNKLEDLLKPIQENIAVHNSQAVIVKSKSLRLGQPRIRTSFIETVDLLAIMESVSESKLNMSSVKEAVELKSRSLSLSDGEQKAGSSEVLRPKGVRVDQKNERLDVICTPRKKSIRISQDLTHDMRRISLHLSEKLILKAGNIKEHYELCQVLGVGSFGKVQRAFSKQTNHEVAIKRIKKKKIDRVNRALLENEIRILREIKHHSVVGLLDVYESNRYICLVMELCSGGDIFDWLDKEEHLDEVRACGIITQIAAAVDYLHSRGVVHRDLKLENILIVKQDESIKPIRVKIADFGFATTIKSPNALIQGTCGSLNYVAPEVLTGRPYTKACDYWSVGVILYAMLGGYLPFYVEPEEGGRAKTFRKIQQGIYDFDDPDWEKVEDLGKSVINSLLTVKVSSRLTCKNLAKHRWVRLRSQTAKRSLS